MKGYKGKRILITGGSGFIGAALAKRLVGMGAIVFVTSRKKHPERLRGEKHIRVLVANLLIPKNVETAVAKSRPEIIFHVASSTDSRQDMSRLETILKETYRITKNVIEAALHHRVRTFIQFGTIEEYIGGTAPYKESDRETPISPYSLGKTLSTHLALLAGRLSPMRACVVRPAATFGPSQRGGMLIPNLIRAGLEGKDFDMNPGEQFRDFIYVDDLVDGVLLAGKSRKAEGEIINFGSGRKVMVKTLVNTLNTIMGNPITIHFGKVPYRPNDSMLTLLDITKAKNILGWEPKTPLRKALGETVLWYTLHHKTVKKDRS